MVISSTSGDRSDHFLDCTFASRYVRNPVPKFRMPESSQPKEAAYQIINDELMLDGTPRLNLASFVTTWMEPECEKIMMASMNKNYVDMDEYPVTTELQNRCVNMIAHLFNAPIGEAETAIGVGTVGSSEAIMLAGLAFKRKWQHRRKLEGKPFDKPNIVTGANVQDMDKSWISLPRYHRKYAEGVWDFMQYAQANADGSGMFYCPCKMCKCRSDMHRFPLGTVWDHLKSNGFWERYTCWIYHGETSSRPHDHGQFYQTGSTSNDPTTAFINDMFPHDSGVCPERQDIPQAPMQAVPRGVNNAGIAKYNRLIAFQQTPLCPGHEKTVLQ